MEQFKRRPAPHGGDMASNESSQASVNQDVGAYAEPRVAKRTVRVDARVPDWVQPQHAFPSEHTAFTSTPGVRPSVTTSRDRFAQMIAREQRIARLRRRKRVAMLTGAAVVALIVPVGGALWYFAENTNGGLADLIGRDATPQQDRPEPPERIIDDATTGLAGTDANIDAGSTIVEDDVATGQQTDSDTVTVTGAESGDVQSADATETAASDWRTSIVAENDADAAGDATTDSTDASQTDGRLLDNERIDALIAAALGDQAAETMQNEAGDSAPVAAEPTQRDADGRDEQDINVEQILAGIDRALEASVSGEQSAAVPAERTLETVDGLTPVTPDLTSGQLDQPPLADTPTPERVVASTDREDNVVIDETPAPVLADSVASRMETLGLQDRAPPVEEQASVERTSVEDATVEDASVEEASPAISSASDSVPSVSVADQASPEAAVDESASETLAALVPAVESPELPSVDDDASADETRDIQTETDRIAAIAPQQPTFNDVVIPETQWPADRLETVAALMREADALFEDNALTTPEEANAWSKWKQVLVIAPNHPTARAGIQKIVQRYEVWAARAEAEGDVDKAVRYYQRAVKVDPSAETLTEQLERLAPEGTDLIGQEVIVATTSSQSDTSADTAAAQQQPVDSQPAPALTTAAAPAATTAPNDTALPSEQDSDALGKSLTTEPPEGEALSEAGKMLAARNRLVAEGLSQTTAEFITSVRSGDTNAAKLYLEAGFAPDSRDGANGFTPLLASAIIGDVRMVELMLEHGADPNLASFDGRTALMAAAWEGHAPVIAALLSRKVKVNAASKDGWTAMHYAAWKGHRQVVEQLLNAGADPNRRNSEGWSAPETAQLQGHDDIASLLRDRTHSG